MKFRKMSFLVCIMLFLLCGISVKAAECQLRVSLGVLGKEVELSLYKIADVQDGQYEWDSEYQGIDVELSGLSNAQKTREAAKNIYSWVSEKNIQPEQKGVTNENGIATFSVKSGVYLIAKASQEGEMSPVLLTVPEDVQGEALDISPKYSVVKDPEAPDSSSSTQDHSGNSENAGGSNQKVNPAGTGDAANLILWGVLMVAALVMQRSAKRKKK